MGTTVYERQVEYLELKPELFDSYLDFVEKALKSTYANRIKFSLRSTYGDKPALSLVIGVGDSEAEVLVVADRNPSYRVVALFGSQAFSLLNNIVQTIEGINLLYSETEGRGVVYFVFVPKMKITPPKYESLAYKIFGRFLFGNLVFLFAFSLIIFSIFWFIFKEWTPVALVLFQVPILLIAHKILEYSLGDWVLSPSNRHVYLVGIKVPLERYNELLTKFFYPKRFEFKRKIYEETIRTGVEPSESYIRELLAEYGLPLEDVSIVIKSIDVYGMVKKVFSRMNLPVPRIIVSNIILPNAAATGVLHSFCGLLITTGLLTKLDEEEIEAVLAHEASHIRYRDPLTLFILSSIEYLTRIAIVYTFWHVFITVPFLELIYLYFSITLLFFVSKFVEARADIDAAVALRKSQKLASALKKIGSRRILREMKSGRLSAWLMWDNHPPITFRIELLKRIGIESVGNPWTYAMKECLKDFARAFSRSYL
ncbi:MAG: M48 family metalloprotease [Thermoproteales archaeon]|nr:M48 family metalloprotease [Thermoproteales archaeon]